MSIETGWQQGRPIIPGYGVPEDAGTLLTWSEVTQRLAEAKNYWVGTVGHDGQPHAVPVWGAWVDDALYLGIGGPVSRRNLAANPRVSVHLESGNEVVMLEGTVETGIAIDAVTAQAIDDQYGGKYEWRPSSESADGGIGNDWYVLRPRKVIAWTSFPADATRWVRVRRRRLLDH